MVSIRTLVVSTLAALAGSALFAAGCGGGSAGSACHSFCDKQYTCGDIDSVKADQCRNKCDATSDQTEAELDKCSNKSDILSAYNECLNRACSDYEKCLETLPSCKGGSTSTNGGSSSSSGTSFGGTACDQTGSGFHVCVEYDGNPTQCPSGSTSVSACSTSNLLGTCTVTSGSFTDTAFYYAGSSITADQAQQACESGGGTWSSGAP